jgi:hypothetical protein
VKTSGCREIDYQQGDVILLPVLGRLFGPLRQFV